MTSPHDWVKRPQAGQSMIEVIIAIAVIIAGTFGTISVIVTSVRAGRVASDRLTALNLAREGIEIVRNIRDSNWLANESWDTGISGNAIESEYTAVPIVRSLSAAIPVPITLLFNPSSWISTSFSSCGSGILCSQIRSLNNEFMQATGALITSSPTNFYRLIYLNPICWDKTVSPPTESVLETRPNTSGNDCGTSTEVGMQVRVEVRWPDYSATAHKVLLEDRLYAWR